MIEKVDINVGGRDLIIETGKVAKQANGSAIVQYGDTMILATAVAEESPAEEIDFFPLIVDYREKTSAAGRFPGGYIKREGRPTEKEILTSRLTDRPVRPLFPEGFFNEVQIVINVLSADDKNDPDILAMVGASAALTVSDIPFSGPVGAVRVGMVDNEFIINPSHAQLENSQLDMVIAGTEKAVLMVEGEAKFISEQTMLDAISLAHEEIKKIVKAIEELQQKCGKQKMQVELFTVPEPLLEKVEEICQPDLLQRLTIPGKKDRSEALKELKEKTVEEIIGDKEEPEFTEAQVETAYAQLQKNLMRKLAVEEGKRIDGRGVTEIRPITCEVGILPRTHGSALFARGETQALAITTLGGEMDEQRADTLIGEESKKFMLHYNFPPFSTGEVKPIRGPSRRDIGHGVLAERALQPVLPSDEEFPYTIRVTSDILESNGSSSMASVCSGSMSLMDAGVPLSAPVAGIAMGLIVEKDKAVILADILGTEDALGDMDLKVAGTAEGITAFQMDTKTEGITKEIIKQALEQARSCRLYVLEKMAEVIQKPRESISVYAPRIAIMQIHPDKIGNLIGPGGQTIRKITSETGAEINIDDSGRISIYSTSEEGIEKAKQMVEAYTAEVEIGKIYRGTVRRITDFGAFVEILPGQEGLVHISKLADYRVARVQDVVRVGDEILVKVTDVDEMGRINLSRRDAIEPTGAKKSSGRGSAGRRTSGTHRPGRKPYKKY